MSFTWDYPVFLIPLEGGYVSVVDQGDDGQEVCLLAVFTSEDLAAGFMLACGLAGAIREIHNAREFAWLLQSLRHPVTRVAFDPIAPSEKLEAKWSASIEQMLTRHLVIDYSPWNYPLRVIKLGDGYASVAGTSKDGDRWTAVGFFTQQEKAEAYLQESGEAGTIRELSNVDEARDFLIELSGTATAVALDPIIEDGCYSARYCFSIQTLLQKYLVSDRRPD